MSSTADQVNGVASSPSDGSADRPPSTDDPRVVEAVREYLALIEAGTAPDRSAFVARYPDVAAVLSECLEGLAFVQAVAPELSNPVVCGPAAGGESLTGTLGDFRLIREVGRGGMGIVYEAEQVSLGRRVALKVLPFAATMDPRQLQRFHNEARAAAGLHHTNIVPVYGVGNERGVHYYAMQFIDGRTLADFIAEQRDRPPSQVPTVAEQAGLAASATTALPAAQATSAAPRDRAYFRRVAEWGIQAAEALDCAHSLGVVHRDVKPANLLVDGGGRLWVTDFGLAQVQSDARLTMTGDLVGTLRYMSPEQALAKRVVIDHRTDIYSLGATLYEVLTLQPAFGGADRQELLRQIAFEEPRKPRRLNKAIPAELETIILKALEKNPAERYATAQELADDLERWSRDEPIRARRPSVVQRARKWCRRHRPVAIGLAAALTAAVVLAVVLGFWYQRRLADTEGGVSAALAKARMLVSEGDKQTDHPERWLHTAQLALAAQVRAEKLLAAGVATEALAARVRQVRAGVDAAVADSRLLVELDRIRLEHAAAVRQTHSDDQQTAPLYAALLGGYGVDPAAPEAAAARVRDSRLRESLLAALADWEEVSQDEAERLRLAKVYQLALPSDSLRERLMAAISRRDGAEVVKLVAELSLKDRPPATVVILARALDRGEAWAAKEQLLRAGLERHRGDFWLNHSLGILLKHEPLPRPEEAVVYLTAALALRPDSPGAHLNLGNALKDQGDVEGAIHRYQAALEIDPNYAMAHSSLGQALEHKGRLDEAIAEYREALRLKPDWPEARTNLGIALLRKDLLNEAIVEFWEALASKRLFPEAYNAHYSLGKALERKGLTDEAIAEYRKALRLNEDYPEAHTDLGAALMNGKRDADGAIVAFRAALHSKKVFPEAYKAHTNLGIALSAKGQLDQAIEEHKEAIRLKPDYPQAHYELGAALEAKGRTDAAIAEYREALRLKNDYPEAHTNLGADLAAKGRLDEAIKEYQEALATKQRFPEACQAHYGLGQALGRKGLVDDAIREYREALRLKGDGAADHYQFGSFLQAKRRLDDAIDEFHKALRIQKDYPEARTNLGNALADQGRLDEAIKEYQEALASKRPFREAYKAHRCLADALRAKGRLEEAIKEYREAVRLKQDFPPAHCNLGLALYDKGQLDEAIKDYREAIRLKPDFPEAHCHLGVALRAKGRLDEAIAEYGKALASKQPYPGAYGAHCSLGTDLLLLVRLDEAIAEFRAALRLRPDFPEAHTNLGEALYAKGQLDEAVAEYQRALATKGPFPEVYAAHADLGVALADKGRLDEAIGEYWKAILLKKDEPQTHVDLGNALYARSRLDEAIVAYQDALGLKQNYPAAHYNLGIVRGAKGQLEEAFAEFVVANKLDPKLPDPLNALARALAMHPNAELCKPRQAVALAQKAVQAAPSQGDRWHALGVARYRAGDPMAALAALMKSIEQSKGGDASGSLFLAMAFHQLGQRTEARQHYDRAVAWMEQNDQALERNPQHAEELRRFRDEAEQVLELKKK
jgi:tetratricopeptide (TPR) repeat protein